MQLTANGRRAAGYSFMSRMALPVAVGGSGWQQEWSN